MKRLLLAIVIVALLILPQTARALTLDEYWDLQDKQRGWYTVGVLDTIANEADNGPRYSDCVVGMGANFYKELARRTDEMPALLQAPAPIMHRIVAHELCKKLSDR